MNMHWDTPQALFDELNNEFHFALDAAGMDKTTKCPAYFTPGTDALTTSWKMGMRDGLAYPWNKMSGTVYCCPPPGGEIGKWVRKAWEEAQAGITIVMLIPARTDADYFHDYIYGQAEIRFLRGPFKSSGDEDGQAHGPAPPAMVVIYNGNEK